MHSHRDHTNISSHTLWAAGFGNLELKLLFYAWKEPKGNNKICVWVWTVHVHPCWIIHPCLWETTGSCLLFSLLHAFMSDVKKWPWLKLSSSSGLEKIGLKLWPNWCVWVKRNIFWVSKLTWGTVTSETQQSAFWETQTTLDQTFTWIYPLGIDWMVKMKKKLSLMTLADK